MCGSGGSGGGDGREQMARRQMEKMQSRAPSSSTRPVSAEDRGWTRSNDAAPTKAGRESAPTPIVKPSAVDDSVSASGVSRETSGDSAAHRRLTGEGGMNVKVTSDDFKIPKQTAVSSPREATKIRKTKPKSRASAQGQRQGLNRYKAANAGSSRGSSNKLGGIPRRSGAGR